MPPDGRLAVVARFGVGYDTVDVEACTKAGIALAITPDGVRRPVAVTILTFVLALASKIFVKDRLTRRARRAGPSAPSTWAWGSPGRTFGQLGVGNIGAEMFRLFAPLGMRLIAHDPYVDAGAGQGARRGDGRRRDAVPRGRLRLPSACR